MQNLAMENNLAETAFFVKNPTGSPANYHLRWFTPMLEIDLCGHATLASAFVIHRFMDSSLNPIVFSTQTAGLLSVGIEGDVYWLDFPAIMPQPVSPPAVLLQALGVEHIDSVWRARDYMVVLPSEAQLVALKPDMALLKQLDSVGVIVTAKGSDTDVMSRCFYPNAGIEEDPVTGSAHCNIVPYWCHQLKKSKITCRQASFRGGTLRCEMKNDRVLMGGTAVLFMQGKVTAPLA
jgi:PhzF family phenazine biosynthesis protein